MNSPSDDRGRALVNVLFINTDQQRFDALSCAGNDLVATPNLDRLAHEGVRFSYAFTPSAHCAPARCSFHTGLSVHTTNVVDNQFALDTHNFGSGSFDQNLARLGYRTEYIGRWHSPLELTDCYRNPVTEDFLWQYRAHLKEALGDPPAVGLGQQPSVLSGWPYDPDPIDPRRAGLWPHRPEFIDACGSGRYALPAEYSYSAFVSDKTIEALQRLRDEPFSINAAYLAPHHPWYVPSSWSESIDPSAMRIPTTIGDPRSNTPWGANYFWQIPDVFRDNMRLLHARYYQLVQETDFQVGRVLTALDELGLTDRTLVIFFSDHGEFLGDHGLTQKFLPYHESIRIPMILRLPGRIPAGRIVDAPVNSIDLFATIFDSLALPCPPQEGTSLLQLVEGRDSHPEYTFAEQGREKGVVAYTAFVSSEWKYVWTRDPDEVDLLFDLSADPHELNNLLGANPDRHRYVAKAKQIRARMTEWMETIQHPYLDRLAASEVC